MRAWIISDIHIWAIQMRNGYVPFSIPAADVCILAGDVSNERRTAVAYVKRFIAPMMPVVMVLGNHDYYGGTIQGELERALADTAGTDIQLLEDGSCTFGNVRFVGATLWTDFAIPFGGNGPELPLQDRTEAVRQSLPKELPDFKEIHASEPAEGFEMLQIDELVSRHIESRDYIEQQLAKPFAGKTVVLSHHAPLAASLDPKFAGEPTNAAYASDLSGLIERGKPDYWIHGHTHQFHDYQHGHTRVVCNPKGFPFDKSTFKQEFIIEL